ncbi:hypothetical protein [Achromobacter denitrificans]|uniref:hypothetical protein n=1 Tax=Achromobacter denitrificans TaxID=32002 RepID=UPI003CFE40CD
MSIIFEASTAEQAISTMQIYGGAFIKQLAQLWCVADPVNRGRLQVAFRAEFDKYAEDAKILKHYQGMAREAELAARN